MKSYVTTLFFLASISFVVAQTRINTTIIVDSVQREFIISKPSGAAPSDGYPLVFMFHGTGGDGDKFYNTSGWKEKGEAEKFVTAFPSSLEYLFYNDSSKLMRTTKWKNGESLSLLGPGQYMKDDIHFVRVMLDTIQKTLPIDRRRIYASGFSNGGAFVSKLAVEMSDIFAAISCAGGLLAGPDSGLAKRSLPLWFILGTKDGLWLPHYAQFGLQEFPFNDSTALFYLRPILSRYLGALSLTNQYTKDSILNTLNYTYTTPSSSIKTYEFKFTLINNMLHIYPNGTNHPFVAANFFWDFFKKYPLPITSSIDSPTSPKALTIYPNPVRDFLIVDGTGEMTLTLRNILGQEVFTTRAMRGERIQLPRLTRGIYVSEIISGKELTFKTIAIH